MVMKTPGMSPYASLLLAVLSVAPPQALPQSPNGGPAFEVASVKPAHGGPVSVQADPGRLTINDETLEVLIRLAYGLREYEYSGPQWLHTARCQSFQKYRRIFRSLRSLTVAASMRRPARVKHDFKSRV